jgi:hypothetical protein
VKYQLEFLSRESDINKVLGTVTDEKTTRSYRNNSVNFLFVSMWDKWCKLLLDKLTEKYTGEEGKRMVYIVNSFDMPHSFMIFNTKITPTLVKMGERKSTTIDRLPLIYSELGL